MKNLKLSFFRRGGRVLHIYAVIKVVSQNDSIQKTQNAPMSSMRGTLTFMPCQACLTEKINHGHWTVGRYRNHLLHHLSTYCCDTDALHPASEKGIRLPAVADYNDNLYYLCMAPRYYYRFPHLLWRLWMNMIFAATSYTNFYQQKHELIKELSSGAFSCVLQMRLIETGDTVVIKRLPYTDPEQKRLADEEVEQLKRIQSRYVVQFIEAFPFDKFLCIVMEFCSGGNLRNEIDNKMKQMTIIDRKMQTYKHMFYILSGLQVLHQLGIIHQCLSPENILLDKDGNSKLSHFVSSQNITDKDQLGTIETKIYTSPEAFVLNMITAECNIWSVGVIIIEMITGQYPFEGQTQQESIQNIKNGNYTPLPDYIDGDLKTMLVNMLNLDPNQRPSAEQLLNSELMQLQAQIQSNPSYIHSQPNSIHKPQQKRYSLPGQYHSLIQQVDDYEIMKKKDENSCLQRIADVLSQKSTENQLELQQLIEEQENACKELIQRLKDSKDIQLQQEDDDCWLLTVVLEDKQDDSLRQKIVDLEIVESLLIIFLNRSLELITKPFSECFSSLTNQSSNEINQIIISLNPYPSLFRLIDHENIDIAQDALFSISNLIQTGSQTTSSKIPHPHFTIITECTGIEKIYQLFKRNENNKYLRDVAAYSIGQLFRVRQIDNNEMQKDIIKQLISLIIFDQENNQKKNSTAALNGLAQNDENFNEIIKYINMEDISRDLGKNIEGNVDEMKKTQQQQEGNCLLLTSILLDRKDNQLRQKIINSRIAETLLHIFLNRNLELITQPFSKLFHLLTLPSSDEIKILLFNQQPYLPIIRLLDHNDCEIVEHAIYSISNILHVGSNTESLSSQHPHFNVIFQSNGINKIFKLLNRDDLKQQTQNVAAECLGFLFQAREVTDDVMKSTIVSQLISTLYNPDNNQKNNAKYALIRLAQNNQNLAEITKDIDLEQIGKNLKMKIQGSEQEQKDIQTQQEGDCLLLISILDNQDDDKIRLQIVNSGIVESLLLIFLNRSLDLIYQPFAELFLQITDAEDQINQHIFAKNPYPSLLRLLDHENTQIVEDALLSIYNILTSGSNTTSVQSPHPHYDVIQVNRGAERIYQLFKRTDIRKIVKDSTAECLSHIYKARQINNDEMKEEIISHLESMSNDIEDDNKEKINQILLGLKQKQ
ncbi:MAG: putative protein kinase [Streblomastix strix]|uniref:Protein kinase domain-containing protein n=1 Tax=Streblomastix strix TaxID=222440 RepID=A0A5J4WXW7_9EUKA|nr:MAG: putative protein kinase [Streblomastix strix]